MIIEKDKIITKLSKSHSRPECVICKRYITSDDLTNYNFEYIKNKRGEKYFHKSCYKEVKDE